MKLIPLYSKKVGYENLSTQVDGDKFDFLSSWRWGIDVSHEGKPGEQVYVARYIRPRGGKLIRVSMHRVLLGLQDPATGEQLSDKVGDHIDRRPLNNQLSNLRAIPREDNHKNRNPKHGGTSIYRGVTFNKAKGKWKAVITINGVQKHLGYFDIEIEASNAYETAKLLYHIV